MTKYIAIVAVLGVSLIATESFAWRHVKDLMTPEAIKERTKPFASVVAEGGPIVVATDTKVPTAERVYKKHCKVCHQGGVAGAPKHQNKTDWEKRLQVGVDALVASAIKGKGGMPPKGTCMSCTDSEIKETVEYMLPL